jgi:hypothetical protein
MISADEYARFDKLRADLFDVIALLSSRGESGKRYEGTFRIQFPGYFDSRVVDELSREQPWALFLDCYLIGPHRHYDWWGATFADVLGTAEADIRVWLHEAQEDDE